ncbi:ras guanine nucleotide exchange factor domain-containing protein [Mycena latifolia]|nr:ras guanine nucleotide exchange factor domain-containing protein [Mycena latifolia]
MARGRDMFADLMGWIPPATTGPSASFSFLSQSSQSGEASSSGSSGHNIIPHPFGPTVLFESPARKPMVEFLPTPRLLREMQSFESGLTAKRADMENLQRESFDAASVTGSDVTRPRSPFRLRDSMSAASFLTQSDASPSEAADSESFSAKLETAQYSRYATDVFDVLQTYRGLPLLEKLASGEETTVIKMSLSASNTAAPRNDPRFVIWGEVVPEREPDDASVSQGSYTDGSSSALWSSMSKKLSLKSGKAKAEVPTLKVPSNHGAQKILVAATIERWIAQLTSDLNYDELLNFFLTYRTYISAVDLCHLLICRFSWALQQAQSPQDEVVRRVVRIRTFIAIRYWLLTFFTVDFLPDRELRLLVAHWLNTLIRDPILTKHVEGLSIVRKLKKVAKDCKKVYTRAHAKPKEQRPTSTKSVLESQGHVLGKSFAAATRKVLVPAEEEDSDVDLDFLSDEQALAEGPSHFTGGDLANAHLSTVILGSSTRASTMPLSSLSILQRMDHLAAESNTIPPPFVHSPAMQPNHPSALSRAFVKTIGRLGRWKRVLNQRSTGVRAPLGAGADVNATDLELTVGRDLLSVNGGAEQYLKMIQSVPPARGLAVLSPAGPIPSAVSVPHTDPSPILSSATTVSPTSPTLEPPPIYSDAATPVPAIPEPVVHFAQGIPTEEPAIPAVADSEPLEVVSPDRPESIDRPASFPSASTDSLGVPIASGPAKFPAGAQSQLPFDVISVDELDLSDDSWDEHPAAPPGLRQPMRRLPLGHQFEFVLRSDSVSSMGLHSNGNSSRRSSVSASSVSTSDAQIAGGNIHQWQLNALVPSLSDDDEGEDVEAALHQLEGQINPQKQQEKAEKVDGWILTMRERFLNGDYDDNEEPQFWDEDEDDDRTVDGLDADADEHRDVRIIQPDESASMEVAVTPILSQSTHMVGGSPGLESLPRPSDDAKPAPEDAVPLEILQSRTPVGGDVPPPLSAVNHPPVSKFVAGEPLRPHRSFILRHRAQVIAAHFAMIDRELFMGVKFEEVLDDGMSYEDVEVLDWAQFLRDRARWKSDPEWADKISALAAVRARFNLMTNFIMSEIVLAPPSERHAVVAKFIRIAFNSYLLSSFNTLVAIISGLRSPLVTQAIKTWKGVGKWEMRVFNDLKVYVTSTDDFKYIRQAIAEKKSQDVGSPTSVVSGSDKNARAGKRKSTPDDKPNSACVPFIGVYLSQLHRHNKLPDLIDPTAPTEAVGVDPVTSSFEAPAHPEVFSALAPLPPSMHLEPLINVHKQRLIAGAIKSLVAGQHLASRVHFPTEKRLYYKCLRLRGLDMEALRRAAQGG